MVCFFSPRKLKDQYTATQNDSLKDYEWIYMLYNKENYEQNSGYSLWQNALSETISHTNIKFLDICNS